jgi:hypothetical protein
LIHYRTKKAEHLFGFSKKVKKIKNKIMKKAVFILMMAFATSLSFGQETETTKTYDQRLIGCWKGSEIDQQQKGVSKYWVSCRLEDGKSIPTGARLSTTLVLVCDEYLLILGNKS